MSVCVWEFKFESTITLMMDHSWGISYIIAVPKRGDWQISHKLSIEFDHSIILMCQSKLL